MRSSPSICTAIPVQQGSRDPIAVWIVEVQQFLEDQSCREDLICPQKCLTEGHYLGCGLLNITAQSQ
jgi:hypothetical protein